MTSSDLSFIGKVALLSAAIGAAIKYLLPVLLAGAPAAQNSPSLATVVALLLAPSGLMGGLLWLGRQQGTSR
jgi:hypothetical protein